MNTLNIKVLLVAAALMSLGCASKTTQWAKRLTVQEELKKLESAHDLKSLCRYRNHIGLLHPILTEYKIPLYFDAIPFIETGYQNLPGKKNAGIWHMEYNTAQLYRLRIEENLDERTDLEKSSRAAAKYFKILDEIFHDWLIVALAYYQGEGHILALIREKNMTDPWELEKALTPQNLYMSRFAAAVIYLSKNNSSCSSKVPN